MFGIKRNMHEIITIYSLCEVYSTGCNPLATSDFSDNHFVSK